MAQAGSLRQSLSIQLRVIGALLMREVLTRYGRHNLGFMWLFVEPMTFTLGVTALWSFAGGGHFSSMPVTPFALTGYSSILLWRNMPTRCNGAIEPNAALLYHRNVKVLDIFLSRVLLEIAGATISFIVLGVFFVSIGWTNGPNDIAKVLLGWGMLAWFGVSLALITGSLSARSELVEKVWHPMSYLIFPLSGAAFMVDWLPASTQQIVLYFPMVHGVEMLRDGFFGQTVRTHYDMVYMFLACLCMTFLGLALTRETSRRVAPE
jgi:capsular polysaccharide transport system permease protein